MLCGKRHALLEATMEDRNITQKDSQQTTGLQSEKTIPQQPFYLKFKPG